VIPNVLRRRSSIPSNLVTGLIGWNGFAGIVPLAFGYTGEIAPFYLAATIAAVLQVLVLRLAFVPLRMDRSLGAGVLWGGLTAVPLVLLASALFDDVRLNFWIAMGTGVYVGLPVGGFLSYFHRDDREIESTAAAAGREVDYGRDGHWLDPFAYGAICFLIACLPRNPELFVSAVAVGSIVGVAMAGVSHFFLSHWDNAVWTIPASAAGGACLGIVSGLLFRSYQESLWLPHLAVGALGGFLTCLLTAATGRYLGLQESSAVTASKE